jgi:hypothetical protein
MMTRRCAAVLTACTLLAGCRVVDEKLDKAGPLPAAAPAATPTPAAAPVATPMAQPAVPVPAAPAQVAPKASEPAAKAEPTVETKPAEPAKAETVAKAPVSLDEAEKTLREAGAAALKLAAQTVAATQMRAAADVQRKDWQERRLAFIEAARAHQRYLTARLAAKEPAVCLTHLALLAGSLEGVRRNLGGEPALDQLQLAVAALYSLTNEAGSEEAVVKTASERLATALDLLPPAAKSADAGAPAGDGSGGNGLSEPTSPAEAPAAVARPADAAALATQVQAIADLLPKDHRQGRARLQALLLVASDTAAIEQLDLIEVSRKWLLDAIGRGDWDAAGRNATRLGAELDELAKLLTPPAPAAAPASAPAAGEGSQATQAGSNAGGQAATKAETPKAAPKAPPAKSAPAKGEPAKGST